MSGIEYIYEEKNEKAKHLKPEEYKKYLEFINYKYFNQNSNNAFNELREYIKEKYQNSNFDGDIIAYYVCKLNEMYKTDNEVAKNKFGIFYRDLQGDDNNTIVNSSPSGRTAIYKCNLDDAGNIKKLPALDLLYNLNDVKPVPPGPVSGGSRRNKKLSRRNKKLSRTNKKQYRKKETIKRKQKRNKHKK
jgi:hypothetical protein